MAKLKNADDKLPVAVLISGRGSNLQALMEAAEDPSYPARIVQVISEKPDAPGLQRAEQAGIPGFALDRSVFQNRHAFEQGLHAALTSSGAKLICLAGFMRVLSPWFVEHWHDRLINIHPSLLPDFPGLNAQEQALKAGVKTSGCTVHFVRAEVDHGPVLLQASVPVLEGDTAETLSERILQEEHKIYPQAVRLIAEGRVKIENELAVIADKEDTAPERLKKRG